MGLILHEIAEKGDILRDFNARQSSDLRRARICWARTPVSYNARSMASLGIVGTLSGMGNRGFWRDYDCDRLLTALIGVITLLNRLDRKS
jgi:hypothetical protein